MTPTVFDKPNTANEMADDKSKRDNRDRLKAVGGQDYEVQHLAAAAGISERVARELIKRFGNSAQEIVPPRQTKKARRVGGRGGQVGGLHSHADERASFKHGDRGFVPEQTRAIQDHKILKRGTVSFQRCSWCPSWMVQPMKGVNEHAQSTNR